MWTRGSRLTRGVGGLWEVVGIGEAGELREVGGLGGVGELAV